MWMIAVSMEPLVELKDVLTYNLNIMVIIL
jgi:hypothetical protein